MPSTLYSLIEGRDLAPKRIDDPVAAGLTDWFGKYLVEHENSEYPITFRSLLADTIPHKTWVPFAVGDGTYLNYKAENAHIPRDLRFVVVATPTSPSTTNPRGWPEDAIVADVNHVQPEAFKKDMPTLFIVGSTAFDSETAFLQIASWEPTSGNLNFYQRDVKFSKESPEYPSWLYLGSSSDAFEPDTRGKGPFDGHVNGTLVMKELNTPWVHWNSMKFNFSQTFPPDSPLRTEPLLNPSNNLNSFDFLAGADRLEPIVKKAADKWFTVRERKDFGPISEPTPTITHVRDWIQHILDTTTINISAAGVNSEVVIADEGDFWTPLGMFYDSQALENVVQSLGTTGFEIPKLGSVSSKHYNATIQNSNFALKTLASWKPETVAFNHEGQSPWTILVPSLEDYQGYLHIRDSGLLNHKTLASLLMIDFYNPVYSWRKHQLMRHIPSTATRVDDGYTLSDDLRLAISLTQEAQIPGTPEHEFMQNISLPDDTYDKTFAQRVIDYLNKIKEKIDTQAGVDQYMLLAESRRRIFRPHPDSAGGETNPLSEFPMTLPYATGLPPDSPFQEMTEQGEVVVMHGKGQALYTRKILEQREDKLQRFANVQNPCGAFRTSMCPFAGYHMPILNGIKDNEPKTSKLWEDPKNPVGSPGNAKWAGAESLGEAVAFPGGYGEASMVPPEIKKIMDLRELATRVQGPEAKKPTWDDHIAGLFTKPFWIPEGTERDRVTARWIKAMKGYMIDLESYESVKPWAVTTYYHLRGRSMPLPGELGEQEYFPREACELIRLWINQGMRKTTDDEIELREEEIEDIDESEWEIPRVRKDILELTQNELDYYRMQLDDVLRAGDPDSSSPWQKLGSIHTEWCLHYQEAFLPWHRAHLLYMESLIGCAIPYWNFFAKGADEYGNPSAGIPQAFLDEEYKHPLTGLMRPNPLKYACANSGMSKAAISPGYQGEFKDSKSKKYVQRDPLLTGGGTEEERREKISKVKLYQDQILNALTWPIFSQPQGLYGYPWANIQSFDPPPSDDEYPNREDFDGLFEQPHDNFHGWIGPDMADNSYTAFDPIFWSYHANVDRIFEQYIHDHQDATFSSIFPLQPFTGARADKMSLGDPRKHIYTTIGDMAKTSLALGYSIASPVHQDCPPRLVLYGREGPTAGSKTPYVLFQGVKCTTESYTIDVYIDCPETSRRASVSNKHYVGRLTRMGMGASASKGRCIKKGVTRVLNAAGAAECLCIRDDAEPVLSQVVTDIKTGETVSEEVYKQWDGFVGKLVWGAAMPQGKGRRAEKPRG